jgi:hypothetical protein
MSRSNHRFLDAAPSLLVVLASVLLANFCFAGNATVSKLLASLPAVQAQLVFDGAQLGGQQMSSYRLVTKLSPERLVADVETLWASNEKAKVWRSETGTWLMVSKVESFPEVEVLQARRGATGETIARLSFAESSARPKGAAQSYLVQWLPLNSKVLQFFASTDPGRAGHLLIARTGGSLQANADWIVSHAQRIGFRAEPRLKANLGSGQSLVAMLSRGDEEVILTLDRMDHDIAIVLQQSQGAR